MGIRIENVKVFNIAGAVYSARNPLNSWDKSDSDLENDILGENDHALAMRLVKSGSDHRKFLRQIIVSMDVIAPLYWWKEHDQYKVGTTTNSCSTMHKIHAKEFELSDFSWEHLNERSLRILEATIDELNYNRVQYLECTSSKYASVTECLEAKKTYWWQMIQLLPTSYEQKRTVLLNYEVLRNIYHARNNHKLDEWHTFCEWIETLPYSELITEA